MITISCVIPTFNRRQVLVNTVEMLLDQESPAHDIVVVDQSTEIPPEVAEQLRAWHEGGQIKWVRQEEPNASMARNRGALESSGEVILFLDDDVEVRRDFIASYQRAFSAAEVRGVAGQILDLGRQTTSELPLKAQDEDYGWMFCKANYEKPFIGHFVVSANMGVRRADFMEVGGMNEHFMKGAFREESDFAMRWRKSGRVIHFRPDVTLVHLAGVDIQDGGARHWTYRTPWTALHHYFGSWYFLLNHATWRSFPYLLGVDLRSAGLNKRNLRRPWMIPLHLLRWLWMLPKALLAYTEGPRLIQRHARTDSL